MALPSWRGSKYCKSLILRVFFYKWGQIKLYFARCFPDLPANRYLQKNSNLRLLQRYLIGGRRLSIKCYSWACNSFNSGKLLISAVHGPFGWVALSFLFVRPSRYGDIFSSSTSTCPRPPNPYIFWKLMIIAIQKWIRNTNTKTMKKTKTPR